MTAVGDVNGAATIAGAPKKNPPKWQFLADYLQVLRCNTLEWINVVLFPASSYSWMHIDIFNQHIKVHFWVVGLNGCYANQEMNRCHKNVYTVSWSFHLGRKEIFCILNAKKKMFFIFEAFVCFYDHLSLTALLVSWHLHENSHQMASVQWPNSQRVAHSVQRQRKRYFLYDAINRTRNGCFDIQFPHPHSTGFASPGCDWLELDTHAEIT